MNGRLWISKSLGLVSHKQAGLSGAAGTSRGFDAGRLFGLAAAVFFVAMAIFPQSVYSGAPVSYTHLDVYKRQDIASLIYGILYS